MLEAPHVNFPGSELPIKIVLAVPQRCGVALRRCFGCGCLRAGRERRHEKTKRGQEKINCNATWRVHSFTRVKVATKFGSQVLPPSSENDCSNRCESAEMSDQMIRTRMALPL